MLTLPMLVYLLGVDAKQAIPSSLFVVGAASGAALVTHARRGMVAWRIGLAFGAASMVGAHLGGRAARFLSGHVLLMAFACVMIATACFTLRGRHRPQAQGTLAWPRAVLIGAAVGSLAGLVGAGGGFLIVPALCLFGGLSTHRAIGTSALVIVQQSAAGFAGQLTHAVIPWRLVLAIAAATTAGALAGAHLSANTSPKRLQRAFGWLVFGLGVFQLSKEAFSLIK